jgi:hypothetical protein
MRATEAGSHRASGHRIENAPLSEYQMSPLALSRIVETTVAGLKLAVLSLSSIIRISLAMLSPVR